MVFVWASNVVRWFGTGFDPLVTFPSAASLTHHLWNRSEESVVFQSNKYRPVLENLYRAGMPSDNGDGMIYQSVNQMDIPERVLTLYSARFGASEHPDQHNRTPEEQSQFLTNLYKPYITGYNSPVPKFYGSSGQPPFRFDSGAASETNNEYIDFPGSLSNVPASALLWNSCLLGSEYSEDQNTDYNLFVSLMDPSIASFQGPESLVWGSTDDRYSTPKLLSKAATYSSGPSLHIQVVKSESDQRPSRYKPNDQITEFESKISFVPNLLRSQTPIDLTRWSWIYEAFVDPSREELQYVDDKSTSEIDGIRSMQTFSIESRHPQRLMGGSVRYNRMKGPDCITDWWISGLKRSERQNHEAVGYAMELTDAIVAHARTCLMPELLWDSDVPDQSNYLSWKISSVAWQALSCHFPIGFNIDRLFMNRTYISHDPVSLVSEAHRNEVYSAQPLMFMKSSTSQGTSW
ncbi:hypothetical protein B0H10DRAFT_1950459 [Mycena sp. CBHHK59/15]|nr:hypothetical protein B0H10DRAFT_1950459 [Mycena sp. CBHHK59/15]